jgi:hypothetical protein
MLDCLEMDGAEGTVEIAIIIIIIIIIIVINSMVWVRERTTPTERLKLVGEVIANFCG